MLDAFVELAPQPRPRAAVSREVSPYERPFSGFAFKIQANMDPAHRDRIAFVRICSGKFTRGMKVVHHRIGKEITIANATIFMAQDRENVVSLFLLGFIGYCTVEDKFGHYNKITHENGSIEYYNTETGLKFEHQIE